MDADELVDDILRGIDIPDPVTDDEPPGGESFSLPDGYRATETGNAQRFKQLAGDSVRYVQAWGSWLVYRNGVWHRDTGDTLVTEIAKQVGCRVFALCAGLEGKEAKDALAFAAHSESSAGIRSLTRLSRGIPGLLVDHRNLDAHPWLLNVTNGTVDLRTGELLAHDPSHLLTKQAPVAFDPDAEAPLFDSCLRTWQPDPEVREYLGRVVGSGATGIPVEKFFVNHGEGGNGKGQCFGAVGTTLGSDYVVVPHKALLVAQHHQQHDTIKARLHGARMAIAGETDEGDRLDEASLKEITGGDLLEARRMRQDPWQFKPSHTLLVHTNHPPRVRGDDEGIWRRMVLIPWSTTIPRKARDEYLADKLAAEAPGILNWIVAGAMAFHERGLTPPESIAEATAAYRHDQDHFGRFLAEVCVVGEDYSVATGNLRVAYLAWCHDGGETEWTQIAVGRHLTQRGFTSKPVGQKRTRTWMGIGLASRATAPESNDRFHRPGWSNTRVER